MLLLDEALIADRIVLSVIGPHAGEDSNTIFTRKISDITTIGRTLWLHRSAQARPDQTRTFRPSFVIFLTPSSKQGARPTTESGTATQMSIDKACWQPLPNGLGPVTGNLKSAAYALVLSELTLCQDLALLDVWSYANGIAASNPIRFQLGASTVLAQRSDTSWRPDRMRSHKRRIMAVGKFVTPVSVFIK